MFKFITNLFKTRQAHKPAQVPAQLRRAPRQLEEVRELTREERDQLAAFLSSSAGKQLIERARAIEFRDYQNQQPATWRQCVDWIISLSRVPRDNGNEFESNATEAIEGESQFRDRVSP